MTEFTLTPTVVGAIALAVVAAFSLMYIPLITETETELVISEGDIEAINAVHLVKACLETRDTIPEAMLESLDMGEICAVCDDELAGLCKMGTEPGVRVTDLETLEDWNFGYGEDKHTAGLFVNILHDSGRITLGRLYAEI